MIEISTDKDRFQIEVVYNFITHSYWAKGRSLEAVKKTIDNCLCFGVLRDIQIGFARVITNYTVFAYLMDGFILLKYRGNGYAEALVNEVLNAPQLGTCKWGLKTADAHGLYEQFGFKTLKSPEIFMERLL